MTTAVETTPVLIVGGSLVGLSTALFLAADGVAPALVERHPTISVQPRAWGFNPRTMELYRSRGLEPEIRRAEEGAVPEVARFGGLVLVESLAGREISPVIDTYPDLSGISPTHWAVCGQDRLENILRAHAERHGARLHFGTELVDLSQDDEGVTATVRDAESGERRAIRSAYLVAADGHDSFARRHLGIELEGWKMLSHHMTILFRADLGEALRGRRFLICYVDNPRVRGAALMPVDDAGGWKLDVRYELEPGASAAPFPEARAVELVRAAIGIPDLAVGIEGMLPWLADARVVNRFRDGRVFLAGDAAHVMPPTGALGANTGIQDAHNLAWKLAAVVRGVASPELLATYETERRPIAKFSIQQAISRYADRVGRQDGDGKVGDGKNGAAEAARPGAQPPQGQPQQSVDEVALWLGHRYHSAAVLGDTGREVIEDPHHPTAEPGSRAPHVPIERGGERLSTLDLYGGPFVLLAGPDDGAWCAAARSVAGRLGLPLEAYQVGVDVTDVDGSWAETYRLPATGAVLVRPDGFIAWRAPDVSDGAESLLGGALERLLSPEPDPGAAAPRPATGGVRTMETPQDVFDATTSRLAAEPQRVDGLTATFLFRIAGEQGGRWYVKVVDGKPEVRAGDVVEPDVTVFMKDTDFVAMGQGTLDGAQAFMSGRLQVKGTMALALRMADIFG